MNHFTRERLGESIYNPDENKAHITTGVRGTLFDSGWDTICWQNKIGVDGTDCDPEMNTGALKRCPKRDQARNLQHSDPCGNTSYWPTAETVRTALKKPNYDTSPYKTCKDSFRNYLEGFVPLDSCTGAEQLMCGDGTNCSKLRRLHNRVCLLLYMYMSSTYI